MTKCVCGCGGQWEKNPARKYWNDRVCRYRYLKKLAESGEIKPVSEHECPICGNIVGKYKGLGNQVCCQKWLYGDDPVRSQCVTILRYSYARKDKMHYVTKPKIPVDRLAHCYRKKPGEPWLEMCKNYLSHSLSCGSDCYVADHDCYVWP